jgi:hypothetical protein
MRSIVRFIVEVDPAPSGAGWDVRILTGGARASVVADRTVGKVAHPEDPRRVFPVPPRPQAEAIADAGVRSLCLADAPDRLWQAYSDLVARDAERATIQMFGSYLFEVLLGGDAWQVIVDLAAGEPVELALSWAESEWVLTRLPWEMLRHGDTYLAALQQPTVAISRLIRGARCAEPDLQVTPRILFVIGASLTDGQIRAGAEYIELLRHLRDQAIEGQRGLITDVVLDASPQRLREAMTTFEPSIIHFICHGGLRRAGPRFEGFLQMMPDEEGQEEAEPRTAEQLVSMLTHDRPQPPPVVVLNACYSGAQPSAERAAAPLATEMVKQGIPIVVAMWGRVSDRACRLFTWCFYEALLWSKSIPQAVAAGRRMAFEGNGDPAGADWAFPAIFLAENIESVTLDQDAASRIARLESIALQYRQHDTPVFCDRFEILDHSYRLLLRPGERGPRVLAIKVALAEQGSFRYGKTRSLEEMCLRLVLDGHVPCFWWNNEVEEMSTPSDLALAIAGAIATARDRFGLDPAEYEIFKLADSKEADLAPRVRDQLRLHPPRSGQDGPGQYHNQVLAAAIYQDLRNLADAAGDEAREPKVALLLDDVHRFGPAALQLLVEHLLVPGCLSGPRDHVPVVMAFSAAGRKIEYGPAAKDLRSFLEGNQAVIRPLPVLCALPDPGKDRYPWDQFLMGQQPPLVADANLQPEVQLAFQRLFDLTSGAPSMLLDPMFGLAVDMYKETQRFISADDRELLKSWRNQ